MRKATEAQVDLDHPPAPLPRISGQSVFVMEGPNCGDDAACSAGLVINGWFFAIDCLASVSDSDLGGLVAIGSEELGVLEARSVTRPIKPGPVSDLVAFRPNPTVICANASASAWVLGERAG
jgi:hypothetical protein